MESTFDISSVKLRPPVAGDWSALYRWGCELEWFTCPSVIRTWMDGDFMDGMVIAEYQGQTVGTVLAYDFTEKDTFVGFYVVDKAVRGQGIGKLLWAWLLGRSQGRHLWLAASRANLPMYARRGLLPLNPPHIIRKFSNKPLNTSPYYNTGTTSGHTSPYYNTGTTSGLHLEVFSDKDLADLARYESEFSGYDCSERLKIWLKKEPESSPIIVARKDVKVLGYGAMLKHSEGLYKIAPLYADDAKTAGEILHKLVTSLPPETRFVADVSMQEHVVQLFEEILPPGTLDGSGDTFMLSSEGAKLDINTGKLYCYTQLDTVPI